MTDDDETAGEPDIVEPSTGDTEGLYFWTLNTPWAFCHIVDPTRPPHRVGLERLSDRLPEDWRAWRCGTCGQLYLVHQREWNDWSDHFDMHGMTYLWHPVSEAERQLAARPGVRDIDFRPLETPPDRPRTDESTALFPNRPCLQTGEREYIRVDNKVIRS